jgi:hypothetical protein
VSPPHDASQAVEFLTLLWGAKMPTGQLLLLHALEGGRGVKTQPPPLTHWKGLPGILPPLVRKADVYLHVSALASAPPPGKRGTAATASMLAALWLDLDVSGGPADRKSGAPSLDAAIELCHRIATPTLLVSSGYGLHAWWVFTEPWLLDSPEARLAATDLAKRWEVAHRRELAGAWKLDAIGDLARLMRLPGTTNHKGNLSAPVTLLPHRGESIPRTTLIEAAEARTAGLTLTPAAKARETAGLVEGGEMPAADDVPLSRIKALCEADAAFARTWTRKRSLSSDEFREDDDSAWDMAVMSRLDYAGGFSDREIIAAAHHHRRQYGDQAKLDKLKRADYWWGTLAKIRQSRKGEQQTAEAKREQAELMTELAELNDDPSPLSDEDARRWEAFNKALGLRGEQRAVGWKQFGSDPDTAQQVLVLANGVHVKLGSMERLTRQQTTRAAMASAARIPMSMTKHSLWLGAWNVILPLRIDEEEAEEARDQRALHWISDCINQSGAESDPAHYNDAIESHRPIVRDEQVLITTAGIYRHLVIVERRRDIARQDLASLLHGAGCTPVKLSYTRSGLGGSGKRSSHSYWSIPESALP